MSLELEGKVEERRKSTEVRVTLVYLQEYSLH